MNEDKKVVVVNMAINTGSHVILGTDRKTLHFEAYPSSDDIKGALGEDVKFTELLDACEVDDVATYQADYEDNGNFVGFECHDAEGSHVGSIVIEQHEMYASSLTVI